MGDGPPADPATTAGADSAAGGPVLRLLARGLELWLRQQCQAIEELQIQLEGSAAQLMRGRLDGVRLQARGVRFQELRFERVVLRSATMQVRMGALLRQQSLRLEHPFEISGTVVFSAEGLSRSLTAPPWNALGDALAAELLGQAPLVGLRFDADRLILCARASDQGQPLQRPTRLLIEDGGLLLRAEAVGPEGTADLSRLPRDANIRFERAQVRGEELELQGRAQVST
jgi:hypothetical protein